MQAMTRDVVVDLWSVYSSGEASADTVRLVDEYLASDPEFAREMRGSASPSLAGGAIIPPLAPNHELRTLEKLKRRLLGPQWLLRLAIMFSAFAFGRIVSDTSWDVSPRNFIVMAAIAVLFWIAFLIRFARDFRGLVGRTKKTA